MYRKLTEVGTCARSTRSLWRAKKDTYKSSVRMSCPHYYYLQITMLLTTIKRVSVPPKVIDEESSMDLVVKEGSDMLLQCKARGYPEPYIMWRREDGLDINYNGIVGKTNGEILSGVRNPQPLLRLRGQRTHCYCRLCVYFAVNVVDGERLMIRKISRLHMGPYLCVASNGVPPTRNKRINVTVHCKHNVLSSICG